MLDGSNIESNRPTFAVINAESPIEERAANAAGCGLFADTLRLFADAPPTLYLTIPEIQSCIDPKGARKPFRASLLKVVMDTLTDLGLLNDNRGFYSMVGGARDYVIEADSSKRRKLIREV